MLKRSTFVLLTREPTDGGASDILFVWDRKGRLSLPGGKEDPQDKNSQFATARREFREETGKLLPKTKYQHIEWGDQWHVIRVYYAEVGQQVVDNIHGEVQDPTGSVVECEWISASSELLRSAATRIHIIQALALWRTATGSKERNRDVSCRGGAKADSTILAVCKDCRGGQGLNCYSVEWSADIIFRAAHNGHLRCLRVARAGRCPWDERAPAAAAGSDNLRCLQFLRENNCPWDENTPARAALAGSLRCLEYARINTCPWDEKTIYNSAAGNNACMRYADENKCPWGEVESVALAAAVQGSLANLQYICKRLRPEDPWSKDAVLQIIQGVMDSILEERGPVKWDEHEHEHDYLGCLRYARSSGFIWPKPEVFCKQAEKHPVGWPNGRFDICIALRSGCKIINCDNSGCSLATGG